MKHFLLGLLVLFSQYSSAQQKLQSEDYLLIGSGGGFTGRWEFYKIKNNGEIRFRANLTSEFEKIGKISKKQVSEFLEKAEQLQLDSLALNEPGNVSYLIEYQVDNKKSKAVWSFNKDKKTPQSVTDFYENILLTVSSKR